MTTNRQDLHLRPRSSARAWPTAVPRPTTLSAALALGVLAFGTQAAVLDFESINGVLPVEGMAISNQFQPYFGVSFRRLDGGYPVIGKEGVPRASFIVQVNPDLDLYDTLHPSDPRAGSFGEFFLTDDGVVGGTKRIIMDFAAPVSRASGYIFDIDASERMTIQAYSDDGITEVDNVVLLAGAPETGNGRSTYWSFERTTRDIRQIRFRETGPSSDANVAFDSFESDYEPPPVPEPALNLHTYAGVTITGVVGRSYRIDYADKISGGTTMESTNWVVLTNLFLPSSPFLFIDNASMNAAQRYYRVQSLP